MAGLIRGYACTPPSEQQGFLLPLALMCTLLLLLSGTSLQLAVLQAQRVQAAQQRRSANDDVLISAAHATAAQLLGRYRCLQDQPFEAWTGATAAGSCPPDLNPASLIQVQLWEQGAEISGWTPSSSGGVLSVRLPQGGPERHFALSFRPALALKEAH